MTTVARRERAALADLLDEVGPDQTTLCEGWSTEELLLHLLLRERPGTVLGTALPVFRSWNRVVARRYRRRPWAELVNLLRRGPGLPNPIALEKVDAVFNAGEYFIHHEDVRRGQPGWTVRDVDDQTNRTLVRLIRGLPGRYHVRKLGVGVRVRLPDGRSFRVSDRNPAITLVGEPSEVMLWISGRRECEVAIDGSPDALRVIGVMPRR